MPANRYLTKETIEALRAESRGRCCVCAKLLHLPDEARLESEVLHKHHIVYLSQNGDNTAKNIVIVCPSCHARIHADPNAYPVEKLIESKKYWKSMRELIPEELDILSADGLPRTGEEQICKYLLVTVNLEFTVTVPASTTVSDLCEYISRWILHPIKAYARLSPFKLPIETIRLSNINLAYWGNESSQIDKNKLVSELSKDEVFVTHVNYPGPAIMMRFEGARITLMWGATPSDLDLHLVTNSPERFVHIFYGNRGNLNDSPWVSLDVDVTSGYGPETITLESQAENDYLVAVHNFSGEESISISNAKVIIEMAHCQYEFICPNDGDGTIWLVCHMNAFTSQITEINRITSEVPPQLEDNNHRRGGFGGHFSPW